jgi:cell division protein ZapE
MSGPEAAYRARVTAGAIEPDEAQRAAVARLQGLHEALAARRAGTGLLRRLARLRRRGRRNGAQDAPRGLYLHGPPGRGKSMLMDLFFESAPVAARRRVHVHAFMQEVHAQLHRWRQDGTTAAGGDPLPRLAAQIARRSTLLCFDEFQVETIADAMIVRRLFQALFDAGVTVVATSNFAPDALYEGGLHRARFLPFIDLLKARLEVVEVAGPRDWRRDRLKAVGLYHAPLDAAAQAALDEVFASLTGGERGAPGAVVVHGREVPVPRAAHGVAAFGFADLCEAALGPADYGRIAAEFHTVILSGIPAMGPAQRNEAKRFATLVESLYEQRTKLVCSAAVPAEKLYTAGDGAALFTRVVSRLEEMQSEDYLGLPHRASSEAFAA